jgi:hypothetical protein
VSLVSSEGEGDGEGDEFVLRSNLIFSFFDWVCVWICSLFVPRFDVDSNRPRWGCFTDFLPKLHRLYTRDCFNNGNGSTRKTQQGKGQGRAPESKSFRDDENESSPW